MIPYWTDGQATIWHANALDLPLTDASVDLVVTSPPYFGLRSYQDAGEHYSGQIGSEATPAEFVDALIAATREMVRVLKPSGSLWINLGDKYSGTNMGQINNNGSGGQINGGMGKIVDRSAVPLNPVSPGNVRHKSLIGIPWRYALRCIDDLGLILRAEVIWSKPNGLPESVTDRVRRSHEQWFHFVVQPRYYSAVDEVREGYTYPPFRGQKTHKATTTGQTSNPSIGTWDASDYEHNPLGKLPGSVWTIPTQPLRVPAHLGIDHFAAFPMEWPRRIITGWSPRDVCGACGEGRRPVSATELQGGTPFAGRDYRRLANGPTGGPERPFPGGSNLVTITGYACACPDTTAPTTPGIVLDPFGGTGTTALVANALGRTAHHVDLSADYCRLAKWRITDPGERARALEVDKPPVEIDGQDDLLGLLDGEAS